MVLFFQIFDQFSILHYHLILKLIWLLYQLNHFFVVILLSEDFINHTLSTFLISHLDVLDNVPQLEYFANKVDIHYIILASEMV